MMQCTRCKQCIYKKKVYKVLYATEPNALFLRPIEKKQQKIINISIITHQPRDLLSSEYVHYHYY